MSTYFKPYEGKRPYLFISYSHRDSKTVLDTISILHARKLRLWYDEGIPAGSDWPKNIEMHMQSCSAVLFFLSETSLLSDNCRSEIVTARALNKPVLVIPLSDATPDAAWNKLLSGCTQLPCSSDPTERAEAVIGCKDIGRAFYRKWNENFRFDIVALVLTLLLFAAAAVGLYELSTGRLDRVLYGDPTPVPTAAPTPRITPTPTATPDPTSTPVPTPTPYIPGFDTVTLPDTEQDRAVRSALHKSDSDEIYLSELAGITELYFCGSMPLNDLSGVAYDAEKGFAVNGAHVLIGSVSDLSRIGKMTYLKRLALIWQPVSSLSDLEKLVVLEELDLSGCPNVQLSTLPALQSLAVLHLEHSGVKDLTPLLALPALKTVTVSADMVPMHLPESAQFDVVLVP